MAKETEKTRESDLVNRGKSENNKGKRLKTLFSCIEIIGTIGLLALILYAYLLMRPGARISEDLSVTGTMFWNDEPAETVSVILCPSGTTPGPSIFGIGGGCDEKSVPWTIIDASGEYHFFNIPSGEYTIFYKWPGEDDWNLGETIKESSLVFVEEKGVTKVDPMFAVSNDWLIEPKGILNYPAVISLSAQEVTFRWKSLKDTDHYFIGIFDESGEEHPGKTIFSQTVANPAVEVLLPKGNLSLGIRAYNSKNELIGKEWHFFEVKK